MITRALLGEAAANDIRRALGKANGSWCTKWLHFNLFGTIETWPSHNWPNWKNVVHCSHGYHTYLQIS